MKHSNIAIFIPHLGCPHNCSFCDQNSISAAVDLPNGDEVVRICEDASIHLEDRVGATEIAFFGGSFTAIDQNYMTELLDAASYCVRRYGFEGIRCSTRPDAISAENVDLLKGYGVTSIELGCQSMDDNVLSLNSRGHTAQDVVLASKIIKKSGISLGHQMMVGLYGDSEESVFDTAQKLLQLEPDTMRIYPTVVIKGTELANLWESGKYIPLTLDRAVDICSKLLLLFDGKTKVIRLGLHASQSLERDILAGVYHPAFRELCESRIMLDRAIELLDGFGKSGLECICVNPRDVSKMVGQKKGNLEKLGEMGYDVRVVGDEDVEIGKVQLKNVE